MSDQPRSDHGRGDREAGARWQRVDALFLATADLDPASREAFLAAELVGDAGLRAEVEALVRAAEAPGDRVAGAIDAAAQRFADQAALSRVGERVGLYRLVALLGHGGMGTVYLAERADEPGGTQVAIKFVRGVLAAPDLGRRLEREREILASLTHPGIEQLLDANTTDDGTPYLVLEYLKGEPLDQWCDSRGLGIRDRVAMVLQICDALCYAHGRRVVHRDLKPSNILVTGDGTPKLLDFGIAKLLETETSQEVTTTRAALTPAYASPEQVRGERVTASTDVYSLGVVLYRLLAGRTPFDLSGATAAEVERRIGQEDPVPPSAAAQGRAAAWRAELEGELDAVILRALAKQPGQRQPSVAALATDLQRWLAAPPGRHRGRAFGYRLRRAARSRAGMAVIVLLVVLGAAGARAARAWWAGRVTLEFLPVQMPALAFPAGARIRAGDLNGDGRGDLVSFRSGDGISTTEVALGGSAGVFDFQPPIVQPDAPGERVVPAPTLLLGDFNGDGLDDLLWQAWGETGATSRTITVTLRLSEPSGGGRLQPPQQLLPLRWSVLWRTLVGDVDGDDADDLIFNYLSEDNLVRQFRFVPQSGWQETMYRVHGAKGWSGYQSLAGDVDGDGRSDLIWNDVPVWANRIHVGRSRGTDVDLLGGQDHPVTTGWDSFLMRAGDVNGDGRVDLVWFDPHADPVPVHVALGEATGRFRFLPMEELPRPVTEGELAIHLGDLNGDGRADLVLEGGGPGREIWHAGGTSRGSFRAPTRVGGWSPSEERDSGLARWRRGAVMTDVTGDGRLDLVWVALDGSRIQVAVTRSRGF